MTGWSRQQEDSKLSAWAKSQDLILVERELERAKKDLCRAGSVSLKPEYILKRQQERARAKDATNRLSSMGLRFDLGPFLFDYPVTQTNSKSKGAIKQVSTEQREITHLKDELARLKERESELEYALATSESKREEERKAFDRDRKLMMSVISKLKLELKISWNCISKLRQKYEGASFGIETDRNLSNNIYQTDESFERIFRPSSSRGSSEKVDQARVNRSSTRPSSSSSIRPSESNMSRSQSLRKSSVPSSRPGAPSSLRNTPVEGSTRTRRTSLS